MSDSRLILFDLNGTLTNPAAIGEQWHLPDLGLDVLAGAVQSSMVDTILGQHQPFAEHVASSLRVLVDRLSLDPRHVGAALERAARLPAFEDAGAALTELTRAGHTLAVLTNSGADSGRRTLEAAGIASHFEQILSVDAVGLSKPHPSTYAYALRELGREPSEIIFVAAHAWDVTGAKHAGFSTVLIARAAAGPPAVFPAPDLIAASLGAAAAAIIGR